jgi:iron(III)-salmochelin esterase
MPLRTHTKWLILIGCLLLVIGCEPDQKASTGRAAEKVVKHGPRKSAADKPAGEGEKLASLPPKRHEPSPVPRESKPIFEKIEGYKIPAEYVGFGPEERVDCTTVVALPEDYYSNKGKKYPLVIVFGGAGECAKRPRQGALAWLHYYKSDEAVLALGSNRLDKNDFRGLVTERELAKFNRKLKRRPYEGVIFACPSTPLSLRDGPELPAYEEFIMDRLLPILTKHYRVDKDRIGVDGVSMGGSRSMYYGLKYPEVFSSIGAVQGAFGPFMDLYEDLIKINKDKLQQRAVQLVTSDRDTHLGPHTEKMHQLFNAQEIKHDYMILTGPHDYIFNQGPGSIALLMFHARPAR